MRSHYFAIEIGPSKWQPNVDVYETPEAIVVVVELAGVRPQSIDIAAQGRALRVSGSRPRRALGQGGQMHRLEIAEGLFERVIGLPRAVDISSAEAQYHDGFLEIVLPRAQPVRPQVIVRRSLESERLQR